MMQLLTLQHNNFSTYSSSPRAHNTPLSKSLILNLIFKRSYPGNKPTGHARKILDAIHKKPPLVPPKETSFKTQPCNNLPLDKTDKQNHMPSSFKLDDIPAFKDPRDPKSINMSPNNDLKITPENWFKDSRDILSIEKQRQNFYNRVLDNTSNTNENYKQLMYYNHLESNTNNEGHFLDNNIPAINLLTSFESHQINIQVPDLAFNGTKNVSINTTNITQVYDSYKLQIDQFIATNNWSGLTKLKKELDDMFCQIVLNNPQVLLQTRETQIFFQYKNMLEKEYPQEMWTSAIISFLNKKALKTCYSIEDFEHEKSRLHCGKELINQFGNKLPEPIFVDIMCKLGVLYNNDAQYTKDDGKGTIVQLEAEGISLSKRIYEQHAEKYFTVFRESLTQNEIKELETKIINGQYYARIFDLQPSTVRKIYSDIMLASGDKIHIMFSVTIKNEKTGSDMVIGFANLTSTNDKGTVFFGCKQILNADLAQQDKKQYYRPFKQLVHIPQENNIIIDDKYSDLINSNNYKNTGFAPRDLVLQNYYKHKDTLSSLPIRNIQQLTRSYLQIIADDFLVQEIIKLNKEQKDLENVLKTLSQEKKDIFLEKRQNMAKKYFKNQFEIEYTKQLPLSYQELFKLKRKITDDIIKIKAKENEKKD